MLTLSLEVAHGYRSGSVLVDKYVRGAVRFAGQRRPLAEHWRVLVALDSCGSEAAEKMRIYAVQIK